MRALVLAALAASALALTGCQHQAYEIHPLYPNEPVGAGFDAAANNAGSAAASVSVGSRYRPEVFPGRLDGYWFERVIYGAGGKGSPDAIELVYCPIVAAGTVCRTAVIWQKDVNLMLDAAH